MKKCIIGFDNGVSGSICVIHDSGEVFYTKTPSFEQLSYQKEAKFIERINGRALKKWLQDSTKGSTVLRCYLERPMVNPKMFNATLSAIRAYEATLIILEDLEIPFESVDSKDWQEEMLPKGLLGIKTKDKKERKENKKKIKQAADDVARRLYPQLKFGATGGDGVLIAEWARKKWFNA